MYLFCLSYHFPQPVSLDFRKRLIFSAQRGRQGDNCSPAAPVKQNSEQTPSLWYPTRWRSTGTVTRIAGRCFQLHHCFLFFKRRLDFKKKNICCGTSPVTAIATANRFRLFLYTWTGVMQGVAAMISMSGRASAKTTRVSAFSHGQNITQCRL